MRAGDATAASSSADDDSANTLVGSIGAPADSGASAVEHRATCHAGTILDDVTRPNHHVTRFGDAVAGTNVARTNHDLARADNDITRITVARLAVSAIAVTRIDDVIARTIDIVNASWEYDDKSAWNRRRHASVSGGNTTRHDPALSRRDRTSHNIFEREAVQDAASPR